MNSSHTPTTDILDACAEPVTYDSVLTPVNFSSRDASRQAIAEDVDYALSIFESYASHLERGQLVGMRVMELGPGYSLGTAALMACQGARVTVADRYLAPWDLAYHPRFFRALLERIRGDDRFSPEPLLNLIRGDGLRNLVIERFQGGAEDLLQLPAGVFDLIVSNAVLEHVADFPQAATGLAHVTAPGGLGIHQVDFRDHRNFEQPLEFLTIPKQTFQAEFTHRAGECGNRWRHTEAGLEFQRAGFEVLSFDSNLWATPEHLQDVRPRLQPPYASLDDATLSVISGRFLFRKQLGTQVSESSSLARARARYALARSYVSGKRVLDVTCNSPLGLEALAEGGPARVERLDRCTEALLAARGHDPEIETAYHAGDPERGLPQFPETAFDVVVCFGVLEQITAQEHLLAEIRRVLAADGVALISLPPGIELDALDRLLEGFARVNLFSQQDALVSLITPLAEGPPEESTPLLAPGDSLAVTGGPVALVAVCSKSGEPGKSHRQELESLNERLASQGSPRERRWEEFRSKNQLSWTSLGQEDGVDLGDASRRIVEETAWAFSRLKAELNEFKLKVVLPPYSLLKSTVNRLRGRNGSS